jgi:hypothetical protein
MVGVKKTKDLWMGSASAQKISYSHLITFVEQRWGGVDLMGLDLELAWKNPRDGLNRERMLRIISDDELMEALTTLRKIAKTNPDARQLRLYILSAKKAEQLLS